MNNQQNDLHPQVLMGFGGAPEVEDIPLVDYSYHESVNRVIVLRDASGRIGRKARIWPCQDVLSGKLLGVEDLPDEERRKRSYSVTADTMVEVTDGTVFDLSKVRDRLNWSFIQHSEFIAQHQAGCYFQNNATRFFVEDAERDNDLRLKTVNTTFEAEAWVRSLSPQSLYDVGRVLSADMGDGSHTEALLNLIAKSRNPEQAQAVLKVKRDPQFKLRVFAYKLIDKRLLKHDGELYRYNEKVIGDSVDHIITWLDGPTNRDVLSHLYLRVYPNENSGFAGGMPDALRGGIEEPEAAALTRAVDREPVDEFERLAARVTSNRIPR